MLKDSEFETLQKLAKGIAAQFGSDCEGVGHRLSEETMEHSIVAIENGHVTGRKVGDGPSHVVLEQLGKKIDPNLNDHLCYLTRTRDGKLLKSSSINIIGDDIMKRIVDNKEKYLKSFPPNNFIKYQYRFGGYIAERLTNVFVERKFSRIKTFGITVTDQKYDKEILKL